MERKITNSKHDWAVERVPGGTDSVDGRGIPYCARGTERYNSKTVLAATAHWHASSRRAFSANAGFVCIPFFYTGFLLSVFNFEKFRNIHCIIGLVLGSLVCLIINAIDNKYIVSIWCGVIANPVTFLIKAYSGIITISFLSLLTDRILSNNMVNYFSFWVKIHYMFMRLIGWRLAILKISKTMYCSLIVIF